jgi:biopolymer transport protein ExbB/biopolymer transport protein TolQ
MGDLDLMHMWEQMGWVAKVVAFVLVFMSMWSFGVSIERYYTFSQARKQSKLYAPQVAKHLKEGRLKDAFIWGRELSSPPGQGRAAGLQDTSSSRIRAAR